MNDENCKEPGCLVRHYDSDGSKAKTLEPIKIHPGDAKMLLLKFLREPYDEEHFQRILSELIKCAMK
jgi:hypothetical protein